MNAPARPRCTLAQFIPETTDFERIKRDGWTTDGILVINIDDPRLGSVERQVIRHIGDRLFGDKRNGR